MFHRIFYYYKEVGIKFILTEQNGLLIYRTNCAIVEVGMGKSGKEGGKLKEYAYISNGEYNNLRLETGKSYYVRVTDYSGSGYQNAGVITGGSANTYDIKIQK